MNAISFSLYGSEPKYCVGAIRNAELAKRIHPGWKVFIYHDDTVPVNVLSELSKREAQLILMDRNMIPNGMMWRFLIHDHPEVDRYLIRDADSRLNTREYEAVREWIESGRTLHVMRDHPHHAVPIMGGMWGYYFKSKPIIPKGEMGRMIRSWSHSQAYSVDQSFLADSVWARCGHDAIQHDSCTRNLFPDAGDFPIRRTWGDWRFVGEVYEVDGESESPRKYDWEMLANHI